MRRRRRRRRRRERGGRGREGGWMFFVLITFTPSSTVLCSPLPCPGAS
jgi:hypothetical protein